MKEPLFQCQHSMKMWNYSNLVLSHLANFSSPPLKCDYARQKPKSAFFFLAVSHLFCFVLFQEIFIQGNLIILGAGFNCTLSVPVLFEETFYNEKEESFSILCIAHPLEKTESSSMYCCQVGGCLCTLSKLVFVLNKCVHSGSVGLVKSPWHLWACWARCWCAAAENEKLLPAKLVLNWDLNPVELRVICEIVNPAWFFLAVFNLVLTA